MAWTGHCHAPAAHAAAAARCPAGVDGHPLVAAAGHREDALLERAFWSSITLSPPYYGADTPCSFFDEHLRFGWNLRSLKCLLSHHDMPQIPGVTTPMTYFGMWKVRCVSPSEVFVLPGFVLAFTMLLSFQGHGLEESCP